MRNNIIISIFLLLLVGCSSTTAKNLYIFSMPTEPPMKYESMGMTIGVEQVIIPKYLARREISLVKNSNQLLLLKNAIWAENLDVELTSHLINFLQKKFQQPAVYLYPWDASHSKGVTVELRITRYITQNKQLYLDASWEVNSLTNDKRVIKLFSIVVATNPTAEAIVNAMDQAFRQLEEEIAKSIHQF